MNSIERRELSLHFIAEQDGVPERQLKATLIRRFAASKVVQRSYLAQVSYGSDSHPQVALAVVTFQGTLSTDSVVELVQQVFHSLFDVSQHLDIVFPSAMEEKQLVTVCPPFYDAG